MRKKLFSALLAGCMVVAMGSSMVYAEADDTAAADEETLSGEGLKVGFCPMDLSNPFFALMADAAKEEADKTGVELVVTDGQSDAQKQVTALENYLSQGCDAIYVVPVDEESLKA